MINKANITSEDLKRIKLIAIDVDDTLLNDEKMISEENIKIIKEISDLGVKVVIASGRPLSSVTNDIYKELGLYNKDNYFIAYNGACIYEVVSEKVVYSNKLNKDDVLFIDNFFESIKNKSARYVHLDENVTVINPNEYSDIEYKYNNKPCIEGQYLDIPNLKCYKYQVADDPEVIKKLYDLIPKEIKQKYNVMITMPCFIEFIKKEVNKYEAIKNLCNVLEIKNDEVMAIGDSMNDYEMVEKSGVGVAMGNAINEIKEVAKIITETNQNNGVFYAINLIKNAKKNIKKI